MKTLLATLIALGSLSSAVLAAEKQNVEAYEVAQNICGYYIVLGCGSNGAAMTARMNQLGGPFAGGGAGLKVINTSDYPNFRNGFICVVDGPYSSRDQAMSVAWSEAVRDAYVKNGC